ncbi:hypothetical protein LTR85_004791 [Meristemomyces frigidus]|nr:hypothetical protein LTR85_004791 [Meristemomyces frigidus]
MAETAQDVIAASDVPEKEVSNIDNANGTIAAAEEKQEAVAEQKTEATDEQTNGAGEMKPEDTTTTETKEDVKEDVKDSRSESHSPDRKRKEPPVSVSAHDRHDRKRGRGGGNRGGNRYSQVKTRFEEQPESNDPEEIRRQVEFYFSDSNLPIDAYLLNETGGHKNRPIPLKVIHNFKRMRHFQPYQVVRDAIAESKFLDLNDHDEITRKKPLADRFTDDPAQNRQLVHTSSMPRSIYAKGFGEETKTTHLDIEAFFEPYGPLNSVRLRRKDDGEFKGSVFVEFEDEETQQRFMELDPKPQWDGKDLEVMSKQEYVDMKHEGILEGTVKPKSQTERGGHHHGRERRGSKDHVDKDDWKSRRDRDQDDDRRQGGRGGRGGRGRGRGRGDRGGRGRGRDDRGGGRRRSPDFRDRERRNRRDDDNEDRAKNGDDAPPSRAEAEAKKNKMDGDDAAQTNGGAEADAGAAKQAKAEAKADGDVTAVAQGKEDAPPAGAAKKRAREDDGETGADAKKAKEDANGVNTDSVMHDAAASLAGSGKKRGREDDGEPEENRAKRAKDGKEKLEMAVKKIAGGTKGEVKQEVNAAPVVEADLKHDVKAEAGEAIKQQAEA